MATSSSFRDRPLRISYWKAESRVVDARSMNLEANLAMLGELELTAIQQLEDLLQQPTDLLIVAAQVVDLPDFPNWLKGLSKRMVRQGSIWVPALILSEADFSDLTDVLRQAVEDNWYFDILSPSHVDSLPIRVANLLRIHDHLHEIERYEKAVADLTKRTGELETEVESWRAGRYE